MTSTKWVQPDLFMAFTKILMLMIMKRTKLWNTNWMHLFRREQKKSTFRIKLRNATLKARMRSILNLKTNCRLHNCKESKTNLSRWAVKAMLFHFFKLSNSSRAKMKTFIKNCISVISRWVSAHARWLTVKFKSILIKIKS